MAVRPAARRAGPSSPAGEPVQPGCTSSETMSSSAFRQSRQRSTDRPREPHARRQNPKPYDRGLPAMADRQKLARAHPGLPGKRGTLNAPVTNLTVVPPPSDKRTNCRRSPGQVATTAPGSGPARRVRSNAGVVCPAGPEKRDRRPLAARVPGARTPASDGLIRRPVLDRQCVDQAKRLIV